MGVGYNWKSKADYRLSDWYRSLFQGGSIHVVQIAHPFALRADLAAALSVAAQVSEQANPQAVVPGTLAAGSIPKQHP